MLKEPRERGLKRDFLPCRYPNGYLFPYGKIYENDNGAGSMRLDEI